MHGGEGTVHFTMASQIQWKPFWLANPALCRPGWVVSLLVTIEAPLVWYTQMAEQWNGLTLTICAERTRENSLFIAYGRAVCARWPYCRTNLGKEIGRSHSWHKLWGNIRVHGKGVSWNDEVSLDITAEDPIFLHKILNSCWPKTYGKKDMEKYVKTWDGVPSSPKSKRGQKPFRILPSITFPHFEDFGGVSTSNVPSYEWSSWQLRMRRAASVRICDNKIYLKTCAIVYFKSPGPRTLAQRCQRYA